MRVRRLLRGREMGLCESDASVEFKRHGYIDSLTAKLNMLGINCWDDCVFAMPLLHRYNISDDNVPGASCVDRWLYGTA
jgi:hypothetical protein